MKTDFAKGAAWSIVPERFDELMRASHDITVTDDLLAKAEKESLFFSAKRDEASDPFELTEDGTAIIKISGSLMKSPDFIDRLFLGAVGYEEDVQKPLRAALADQRVNGIVLDIDSPGGTVNGADETAEMIFNSRAEKPIIAYSSGMMASAAYWLGSAASRIVVGKNAEIGSIGVLMIHRDWSKAEERYGVKTTYLKAGRLKALGNPSEPLSDEAREVFQAELNHIYSNFVETVALHRDIESEKVRGDMADGRIFIGVQAASAGLADEVGNLQTALALAASGAETTPRRNSDMKIENYDQLKAAAPEILKAAEDTARDDGVKSVNIETVKKEAADSQRAAIIGLAKVHFGEEFGSKFEAIVNSGMTVEQYKAAKDAIGEPKKPENDSEAQARAAALDALKAAGAPNAGAGNGAEGGKDYMVLVDEYRAQRKCSKADAMMAVNRSHPKARQDYINKANSGQLAVVK